MARRPVLLRATQACIADSVEIGIGAYAGSEISRPSMNGPNGIQTDYIMVVGTAEQQGDATFGYAREVNVTSLVTEGKILVE